MFIQPILQRETLCDFLIAFLLYVTQPKWFPSELTPNEKKDKKENSKVASPKSVPFISKSCIN